MKEAVRDLKVDALKSPINTWSLLTAIFHQWSRSIAPQVLQRAKSETLARLSFLSALAQTRSAAPRKPARKMIPFAVIRDASQPDFSRTMASVRSSVTCPCGHLATVWQTNAKSAEPETASRKKTAAANPLPQAAWASVSAKRAPSACSRRPECRVRARLP